MAHVFILFFFEVYLTLDKAYSATYDRLHFHSDIRNPTAKSLPLPLGTQHLNSIIDENKSLIDRSYMAE